MRLTTQLQEKSLIRAYICEGFHKKECLFQVIRLTCNNAYFNKESR
jgi:hypothetical protein